MNRIWIKIRPKSVVYIKIFFCRLCFPIRKDHSWKRKWDNFQKFLSYFISLFTFYYIFYWQIGSTPEAIFLCCFYLVTSNVKLWCSKISISCWHRRSKVHFVKLETLLYRSTCQITLLDHNYLWIFWIKVNIWRPDKETKVTNLNVAWLILERMVRYTKIFGIQFTFTCAHEFTGMKGTCLCHWRRRWCMCVCLFLCFILLVIYIFLFWKHASGRWKEESHLSSFLFSCASSRR